MRPEEIKKFLVTLDPATGKATVREFGTDHKAAMAAYFAAERAAGFDTKLDIVLLGSDSLASIERTHSSYFYGEVTVEAALPA